MKNPESKFYENSIQKINSILITEWDPIGVSDVAGAQDEYHQYVTVIAGLLRGEASENDIARELNRIETDQLSLVPDLPRARRVASQLVGLMKTG